MKSATIVVIDDDDITLEMISVALEDALGATVYSFAHTRQAKEFLLKQENHGLDLIITDKNMPGLSGFDLVSICRRAGLTIPFLMITAEPDKTSVLSARKAGIIGFLAKPVVMDTLRAKVLEIIT